MLRLMLMCPAFALISVLAVFSPLITPVRMLLAAVTGLYTVYIVIVMVYMHRVLGKVYPEQKADARRLLIIAPHQDDGVAMAGGYAIRARKKGMSVHVLFVTDGYEHDKVTRVAEAVDAWGVIGLKETDLTFLRHHTLAGFTTREEIDQGIDEVAQFLSHYLPDTVVIPLYEGGNYQHDVVNYMAAQAVNRAGRKVTVLEAPEYNFYYSFRTTPQKMLTALMRLVPGVSHPYPPEPVLDDPLTIMKLTEEELQTKREMLSRFKTQAPEDLVERFGFEDRFQPLHAYDYRKPPFDYDRSLAKMLNALKKQPVIGGIVSHAVKWTRTIHADPGYTMTRIPGTGGNDADV